MTTYRQARSGLLVPASLSTWRCEKGAPAVITPSKVLTPDGQPWRSANRPGKGGTIVKPRDGRLRVFSARHSNAQAGGGLVSGPSLYPNEPGVPGVGGYQIIAETTDTLLPSSTVNMTHGSINQFGSTPSSLLQVVSTGSVPEAGYGTIPSFPLQSKVLQFNFETGTPPGFQESGSHSVGFFMGQNEINSANGGPAADEFSTIYYSTYLCVFGNGTNIELTTSNIIKLHYWAGSFNNLNATGGFAQYYFHIKGVAGFVNTGVNPNTCTQFSIGYTNQSDVGTTTDYDQNLNLSKHVVVGQVHHMEAVVTIGHDQVADGTVDMWLDGTHVVSYNNLTVLDHTVTYAGQPGTAGYHTLNFEPWWGGSGGANKSRDDYLIYGHMYMSGQFLRGHNP